MLVILKTWPGGRYLQEDFATTSDAEGRFCLAKLVPPDGQHAVQVAAVKEGYALTSTYQLKKAGSQPTVDPVKLALDEAARITLVVHERARTSGAQSPRVRPLRGIRPTVKTTPSIFKRLEPIQVVSDAEGRVGLGCFERGDQAEIYLQLPGRKWESHPIRIPNEGDVVEVDAAQAADEEAENASCAANETQNADQEDALADVADVPAQDLRKGRTPKNDTS